MADDLVKRLHDLHKQATVERSHFYVGKCVADAIHRIEELEAKLAKVKEAFRINMMHALPDYTHGMFDNDYAKIIGEDK